MPLIISIPEKIDDNRIGSSFNHLFRIILKMEQSEEEDVIWDFSTASILNPFFLLPLKLYKDKCGKKVEFRNIPDKISSYFEAIHFYNILDPEHEENFSEYMARFSSKRYIPIIKFPASVCKDDIKNKILSCIGQILKRQLNIKGAIYNALDYLLTELIDNITEHSESINGYIFAQYYRKYKYIDICIADEGITILGSYIKAKRNDITDDVDAIKQASKGVSTKNLPNAENRGYGIVTCKEMLTKGLKGQFFLFSGGAFYRKNENEEDFVSLPKDIKWDGTVVLLRIPYSENEDFNFYDYLEV
ncbi:hypothetical protein [uncultured Bacteroides sp.]|uniref:hypothetical protein n=1 Tax=uncultured Bacteroides sp. TaxID=162156 RepID=UPI002AAC4385|nr:hypothetical protein [uncultured Bacteroides sp.]